MKLTKERGMPNPKAFPTEGPRKTQFIAYDPDAFDVCGDPACNCRKSKWNTRGLWRNRRRSYCRFLGAMGRAQRGVSSQAEI